MVWWDRESFLRLGKSEASVFLTVKSDFKSSVVVLLDGSSFCKHTFFFFKLFLFHSQF